MSIGVIIVRWLDTRIQSADCPRDLPSSCHDPRGGLCETRRCWSLTTRRHGTQPSPFKCGLLSPRGRRLQNVFC
eukprot:1767706-Prymnesium_polylepis.1